MSEQIYRQITMALESGKVIRAIKLLRQAENLDLKSAKDRIDGMIQDMRSSYSNNTFLQAKTDSEIRDASSRPMAHSHAPARSGVYDVEKELPTEAFLYLQKGEVARALKIIQEDKGINKSSATRIAKIFYQQHAEYTSPEIGRLMGSGGTVTDYSISKTDNTSSKNDNRSSKPKKKKDNGSVFKFIFFIIILFNIIRAFVD